MLELSWDYIVGLSGCLMRGELSLVTGWGCLPRVKDLVGYEVGEEYSGDSFRGMSRQVFGFCVSLGMEAWRREVRHSGSWKQ